MIVDACYAKDSIRRMIRGTAVEQARIDLVVVWDQVPTFARHPRSSRVRLLDHSLPARGECRCRESDGIAPGSTSLKL
jgi:hypothetical protein